MGAKEVALEIRKWAAVNGYKKNDHIVDAAAAQGGENSLSLSDEQRSVLHRRGVNLIGFDEDKNLVIIYSSARIPKKEISLFSSFAPGGCVLEFERGAHATADNNIPVPLGVPGYYVKNGVYTCGSSVSVGNRWGMGTLGCLLKNQDGEIFGLSNNHVTGNASYADKGLPILAPGIADVAPGSFDPITIGHHYNVLEFVAGVPGVIDCGKNTDAAIFRIKDQTIVSSMQRNFYDTPSEVESIATGMQVAKVGRTTGLTNGVVKAQVAGPEPIGYQMVDFSGNVYFEPLFLVQSNSGSFATSGDSGSLVVTDDGHERLAVGIVVGEHAASSVCFVLPITPILSRFGLEILSNHNH